MLTNQTYSVIIIVGRDNTAVTVAIVPETMTNRHRIAARVGNMPITHVAPYHNKKWKKEGDKMKRYIVIKGNGQGNKRALYHARGVLPIEQYRYVKGSYVSTGTNSIYDPIVYDDSALLSLNSNLTTPYIFVVEISENQPKGESIEELTALGLTLEVYNENGVLVCDNGVPYVEPAQSTPTTPSGPGEMTTEPIDGPGEML